ncbi:hypothetical protein [Microbispora sp. H10830]|uniref:hypothetical protein n=1 Tax=Microbispora sp. H10830 TaxID=2729109 RepID=UPI001601D0BB|nr:hypothetical protein [Microbispora sp. H10830]
MVELLGAVVSLAAVAVLVLGAVVVIAIATLVWLGAMAVSTGRESYGRAKPVPAGTGADASGIAPVNASETAPVNGHVKGHANGRAAGRGVDRQVRAVAASARRA